MHAPVQSAEIRDVAQRLRPAQHERVVQPHLDIGVRIERGKHLVQTGRAVVVQQQAHAHAPVGGFVQRFQQHGAGHVVVPDVVLHIQAALGRARQHHAGGKGVMGIAQGMDTRFSGVGGRLRRNAATQRRGEGLVRRQCLRFTALVQRRQGAAAQKR
ncbi:hypothetical protein D3C73_976880 [compost metagenome]